MSVMAVKMKITQFTDGYRIRVWKDEKTKSNNKIQHRNTGSSTKKG
jgi:hypothetical protein